MSQKYAFNETDYVILKRYWITSVGGYKEILQRKQDRKAVGEDQGGKTWL